MSKQITVKVKGDIGKVIGYYDDQRRRGGEVFKIEEELFSEKWMKKVDKETKSEKKEDGPREKVPLSKPGNQKRF